MKKSFFLWKQESKIKGNYNQFQAQHQEENGVIIKVDKEIIGVQNYLYRNQLLFAKQLKTIIGSILRRSHYPDFWTRISR